MRRARGQGEHGQGAGARSSVRKGTLGLTRSPSVLLSGPLPPENCCLLTLLGPRCFGRLLASTAPFGGGVPSLIIILDLGGYTRGGRQSCIVHPPRRRRQTRGRPAELHC